MKILFSLISVIAFSVLAQAGPFDRLTSQRPVCYGREYSESHMSSHPRQSVKQMRLMFYREASDPHMILLDVQAQLLRPAKNSEDGRVLKNFRSGMACMANGSSLNCSIDCDGGSAKVIWKADTSDKVIRFVNRGFVLEGGCGEEGETVWLDPKKGGDDIFDLYAIPAAYCQQ